MLNVEWQFFLQMELCVCVCLGKTLDGPPSGPPTDIRVGVINTTAAFVRWSPPPVAMLNGELTGYKVSHQTVEMRAS